MEDSVKRFLVFSDSGDGSGDGYGYGYGDGSGDGYGYGVGSGDGIGDGVGYGYDDGDGYGYGVGSGIHRIDGMEVHYIDGLPTILTAVFRNAAKGFIVSDDLALKPCFVVREGDKFAHGDTLHEAFNSLREKLYDGETEERRLARFVENFPDFDREYPAADLFTWHHILTGSCRFGRMEFCRSHSIDIDSDSYSPRQFVALTKDSYGGATIQKLTKLYRQ